ncbi:MAG: hypothetical protein IME96_12545 [Proteobacteria bacterium]|nr:hypothetical protein [Pseudomonadota bacterium]
MKNCYNCKKEINIEGKPGRRDSCPHCGTDLRVCLNCRFYDESSYNECREPVAERVKEKDIANFCDYFEFRDSDDPDDKESKDETLKKLNALFGD